ncbi:MAG: methionyl-tRNA formyltransferase [Planctomycetes bacterium]|jgi:methionyl-tRNA formyltransferase|nr:methionyl-tRNA formyltransferase [Planctomycetota bacterium]HON44436.1 methionyl-tRNA formyltransferase [Planctomycetota bacterium]HPY75847.1 methionyl-tRNA formyltransferase [Planctomycetota bacterium]HQB01416.1 methionyl-tRNA formyltransferase [Planctomycetota bacterium]HRU52357.1 methionyl-tRNA formyltransferase [Planctomycetota bacterium]
MKIIFFGTPLFSVPILESLDKSEHNILAVVTQPDKRQGRKKTLVPSPVKEYAMQHNIPVFQPDKVNEKTFIKQIKEYKPDVMVLVAFGQFIGKTLLELAPWGILNVHFSLLPRHRGASPLANAILQGDIETGVTIMQLVKQMDAGPILAQKSIPIQKTDTRATLEEKTAPLGAELLLDVLQGLPNGKYIPQKQEECQATYCYTFNKKDGIMNWNQDAIFLERFIRAMNPWPMAQTTLQNNNKQESILIWEATAHDVKTNATPGTIIKLDKTTLEIATKQGSLQIQKLQKAGKNVMSIAEFLCGANMQPDAFFLSS